MRIDLSREQILQVISSLRSTIDQAEIELNHMENITDNFLDSIKETLAIRKSTMLYLTELLK